jgi:predicted signal transduction protein with EAL and GGDEF domain
MECVAEGVENDVHLATLARLGCDEMQGFLFSPGVPADEATALLDRHFLTPLSVSARGYLSASTGDRATPALDRAGSD